jgi:hypothetical protein
VQEGFPGPGWGNRFSPQTDVKPCFALLGQRPTRCVSCRTTGMVDVLNGRCSCGKSQPHSGLLGGKATHCSSCKTPVMVELINKLCPCGTRASFGYESQVATSCVACKKSEMVYVHNRLCLCGKGQPTQGFSGGRATCCASCREDGMQHLYSKKCVVCLEKTVTFDNMACGKCRGGVRLKVWEAKTVKELDRLGLMYSYYDGALPCHKTKGFCAFRPDFVFRMDGYVLILEVDKDQRWQYEVRCEIGRMGDLKDTIELPLLMIRMNPSDKRIAQLGGVIERGLAMKQHVVEQPGAMSLAYWGCTDSRVDALRAKMIAMNTFAYDTACF